MTCAEVTSSPSLDSATADPLPAAWRRLATEGSRRSATATTTREYASSASVSVAAGGGTGSGIADIGGAAARAALAVESDDHLELVSAAYEVEGERLAIGQGVKRGGQTVGVGDLGAGGSGDEVALAQTGPRSRAVWRDGPH